MHISGVTTFLVVALDARVGERVREQLHGTGKALLALDVVTELAQLPEAIRSWQPQMLVVDAGLNLDPQEMGIPLVPFDPAAFDAETLADQVVEGAAPPPPPSPAWRPRHGVAVGFQGIKGGVGTTAVAAGMAVAAARSGYRAAILDLAGDCALTLRARAHEEDPQVSWSGAGGGESAILIVQGPVDLKEIWSLFRDRADVVVVDAGRVGEHVAETRALTRLGVLFFLVLTAEEIELLQPGRYPGYRLFLNREPNRRWWQWDVAGGVPDDPEMSARLNRGDFGAPSPFLLGMQEFTARVVQGEVV